MPSEKYGRPPFVLLPSSDLTPIRTWSRRNPPTLFRVHEPCLKTAAGKTLSRAVAGPQ
jgi:hypothetical protein